MANIDVVRKGTSVWVWVIAAVIVAIVLVALFMWSGSSQTVNHRVSELLDPVVTAMDVV